MSDLAGNALVAPVLDLKAEEVADVVDETLEGKGVLGAGLTLALLNTHVSTPQ